MRGHVSPLARARAAELLDRLRVDSLQLLAALVGRADERRGGALWSRADAAARRTHTRMAPLLETFAELRPHAAFVQIGAHDGREQDPLRETVLRHGWRGVLVEPVPYVFERLTDTYGHLPQLTLANVAVAGHDGTVPFHHLAPASDAGRPGLPVWYDALGSLDRDVVLAHRRFIPDIEERIVETEVPAVTFETLCRRYGVRRLDVLLTDTEGHDAAILEHVDLDRRRPALIVFESVHLAEVDRRACLERLTRFGYWTLGAGLDTWCLNPGRLSEAERARLLPVWGWCATSDERRGPLAVTQAGRRVMHRLVGPGPRERVGRTRSTPRGSGRDG